MSTKTIAVDTQVYDRLSTAKREGESFSKAIDRILTAMGAAHTGRDILTGLAAFEPLSEADSQVFLDVIAENRENEEWRPLDLP